MSKELEDEFQRRGIIGIFMMAVPILSIILVGIGYLTLYWYGYQGRSAEGVLTKIEFQGCAEARPLVEARVEAMGLPAATFADSVEGFSLTTTMPTRDDIAATLPQTLARPGRFAVHRINADHELVEGTPLATEADIESSTLNMTFLDTPRARIKLNEDIAKSLRSWMESHPKEGVSLQVDGRQVTTRANMPSETKGQLDLDLDGATDLKRLDFAVSTAIVLEHGPLPCDLVVAGVSEVPQSGSQPVR